MTMALTRIAEVNGGPDTASIAVHLGSVSLFGVSIVGIIGYLPIFITSIAGILACCMYAVTFYESKTVQHWLNNRRQLKMAKKVAKLKAKQKILEAELVAVEKVRMARSEARELVESAKSEAFIAQTQEATEAATKIPPL
jgi:hypothetical protein